MDTDRNGTKDTNRAKSKKAGDDLIRMVGAAAERESSQNYAGVSNPAIDELVSKVIAANTREQLVTRTRALDRALQWGFYVVPNWYLDYHRFAYQSRLAHPPLPPYVGFDGATELWWDKSAQ